MNSRKSFSKKCLSLVFVLVSSLVFCTVSISQGEENIENYLLKINISLVQTNESQNELNSSEPEMV